MRLFYALSLSQQAVRAAALCAQHAQALVDGRYTLTENYHLTLAFIGETSDPGRAHDVLARCAAAFPAPRVTLDSVGFFGRGSKGVLVVHALSDSGLAALHGELAASLQAAGLPVSPTPFSPHVTLARHAAPDPAAAERLTAVLRALPQEERTFTAAQAHLYLSARDEAGVLRYSTLSSAHFL